MKIIITNADIYRAIKDYEERNNKPVKSYILEGLFDISGITIRSMIRGLRREGVPIASSRKGYSIAKDYDEIKGTILHLRQRAINELNTANRLSKCFNEQTDFFNNN